MVISWLQAFTAMHQSKHFMEVEFMGFHGSPFTALKYDWKRE